MPRDGSSRGTAVSSHSEAEVPRPPGVGNVTAEIGIKMNLVYDASFLEA